MTTAYRPKLILPADDVTAQPALRPFVNVTFNGTGSQTYIVPSIAGGPNEGLSVKFTAGQTRSVDAATATYLLGLPGGLFT